MIDMAVVGLGYWGPNVVRNIAASSRTRLAAICDQSTERLQAVGAQFPAARQVQSFEDVLDDPEIGAVSIVTPVETHYDLAMAALGAGKHVIVEKPLSSTSKQAQELIDTAARCGRVLLVDHVFLYSPAVRKLADLVHSGELGDLQFIDSVRINLGLFQGDVDVVWDLAPHDLSIIDHLVQRPARSVVAVGASHARNDLANVAYLHIDYGDDLLASVHVNWLSPVKLRHFMVGGTRRSVLYNDLDPSERIKVYDRGIDVADDPEGRRKVLVSYRSGDVLSPRIEHVEPLRSMIDHFADCVEHGATPLTGGDQGLRVVRMLEAAGESLAAGGSTVRLDK